MENIDNLVYWYIDEYDEYFEGVIDQDDYEYLKKLTQSKNVIDGFNFEIANNDYIDFRFKDIKYSTEKDDIITFLKSKKRTKGFHTIIRTDLDLEDIKEDYPIK